MHLNELFDHDDDLDPDSKVNVLSLADMMSAVE
jgi:hypothetical protein